jgi:AcrR family transcriptional regulator
VQDGPEHSTTLATPLPPQKRGRERRRQIVEAAWEIVNQHGHRGDALTIREIVRGAGTSTGTVYHYFSDLDEIVAAVVDLYSQRLVLATEPLETERLDAYFAESTTLYVKFFRRYPGLRDLWFDNQASPRVRAIHQNYREQLARRTQQRVATITGQQLDLDVHVMAIALAASLFELAFARNPDGDRRVINELTQVLLDFYHRQLASTDLPPVAR